MIRKVDMYTCVCDNCGVGADEENEYSCWSDESIAWDMAHDADWIEHEGKHYCPDCYSWNDDDKLELKPIK